MKKRILFVGMFPNELDKYLNTFFRNLIRAIADCGIDCVVISPVSITKYRFRISRIPKRKWDLSNDGNRIEVFYPRYFSASSKQIGCFNTRRISEFNFQKCAVKTAKKIKTVFDCTYGHFILDGGLAAIRVARSLNIPAFIAYGECDYESQVRKSYGNINEKDLIGLKGLISVSSKNTDELRSQRVFDNFPILTAPNSIDPLLFHKEDKKTCRKKFNLPDDKFIVGFVGGFIERKGFKRLLEAVNNIDDVFVAFAGKGDEKPSGRKVLFCQSIEHDQVGHFLNSVDVFVLPSLSEGSSNAIVEAMACGLPVVSSNLPFNTDILNSNNSILINPKSTDEIHDAIELLFKDSDLRERLANSSIQTARSLGIRERAQKILNFIFSLIDSKAK
jgi:glycosyltransferase involved in cell wall biosynthesis